MNRSGRGEQPTTLVVTYSTDSSISMSLEKGNFDEVKRQVESYTTLGKVALITQDSSDFSYLFSNVSHVPCGVRTHQPIRRTLYILGAWLWLARRRKEIRLVRGYGIGCLHAALFCRICKVPLVVSYEYDWSDQMLATGRAVAGILAKQIESLVFTSACVTVGLSRRLCEKAKKRGAKKVTCIGNYVDTGSAPILSAEEISDLRRKVGSCDRKLVMYAGRLHRVKRVSDLIHSLALLRSKGVNPILLIAGEGDEKKNLVRLVEEKDLSEEVRFLGAIPHQQVFRYLQITDAFVLPSAMEGNPRVLLEAMFCKVPIVAYNVVGVNDLLDNGRTGLLAEPFKVEELSKAIGQVLSKPEVARQLADEAYEEFLRTEQQNPLERNVELVRKVLEGQM